MRYQGFYTLKKGDHIFIDGQWYRASSRSMLILGPSFRQRKLLQ